MLSGCDHCSRPSLKSRASRRLSLGSSSKLSLRPSTSKAWIPSRIIACASSRRPAMRRKSAALSYLQRCFRKCSAAPSQVEMRSSQGSPASLISLRNDADTAAYSALLVGVYRGPAGRRDHPGMLQSPSSPSVPPDAFSVLHCFRYHSRYSGALALHMVQKVQLSAVLYLSEQRAIFWQT